MIYDKLGNSGLYAGLGQDFREVFEFIGKSSPENSPPGRYDLKNGVYYMVQQYETKPVADGIFEAHRKYIDVQLIVSGRERHDFIHLSMLKEKTPYDSAKDAALYEGKGNTLILEKGFFAIYFPEDGHMPNISAGSNPEKTTKIVFKIPVRGE